MIQDHEFLDFATQYAIEEGLDTNQVSEALRKPLQFLQTEIHKLADTREPDLITISRVSRDKTPFIRVVWDCEDNEKVSVELRLFSSRTEMYIGEVFHGYSFDAARRYITLMAPAEGTA